MRRPLGQSARRFFSNASAVLAVVLAAAIGTVAALTVPATEPVSFDGQTTAITIDEPALHQLEALTVAAWVSLDQPWGTQVFINRGERGQLFTLYLYGDHVRMLIEHGDGRYRFARAAPPAADQWTHLAGTYDGQTVRLYVDGELASETDAPGQLPARQDQLVIGAKSPLQDVVGGKLADVRIYDAALTAREIEQVQRGEHVGAARPIVHLAGRELAAAVERHEPSEASGYPTIARGTLPAAAGFRGIWYANQASGDEYAYKYSGGLGTYPQQHHPIAVYAPAVKKTFFVYGGRYQDRNTLLHMVSYYDHETGLVARPRVLLDKKTSDAHDNPTLSIDDEGYLYVFSSAHGTSRPSYVHRSQKPYDITAFDHLLTTNFSYPQPWYFSDHGFVLLHTRYAGGRVLHVMQSGDAVNWSEPQVLARIAQGHYQVSEPFENKLGTAFNYHPQGKGLNYRTNIYYLESHDGGKTWQNAQGGRLELPLTEVDNPALAVEYESKGRLCYLKCVRFTAEGQPVVVYMTSNGFESGPQNDPRVFTTARWTGSEWEVREAMPGDNNYDFVDLEIRADGVWQLTGTTEPGPQPYNTGGEMAIWTSDDQGATWSKKKQLTRKSKYNHTYPRRPAGAQPDFYVLWADGHGRQSSDSALYFTDRDGSTVWKLPPKIEGDAEMVKPIAVE